MERTVAYGFQDGAKELAKTARESGLMNVAQILSDYAAAVEANNIEAAAQCFSMLHIFTEC